MPGNAPTPGSSRYSPPSTLESAWLAASTMPSDMPNFIEELKHKKPDLEAQQRSGRSIFWDKQVNREAWEEFRAAQVRQKAYVYQTDPKQ